MKMMGYQQQIFPGVLGLVGMNLTRLFVDISTQHALYHRVSLVLFVVLFIIGVFWSRRLWKGEQEMDGDPRRED